MTEAVKTSIQWTVDTPLSEVGGVGPERLALLARLKCHSIGDLLLMRPRRYEDRRHFLPIHDLVLDQPVTVQGSIVVQGMKYFRQHTQSIFEMVIEDGTARLHCRWWNLPFMQHRFQIGQRVMVFGKPLSIHPRTMDHPETELVEDDTGSENIHMGRIVPVYPLTDGLTQRSLRSQVWRMVQSVAASLPEPRPELKMNGWPSRAQAIQSLHFPAEPADANRARERLALDEFIELQLSMQQRRRKLMTKALPLPCAGDNRWMKPWLAALGFELTEAQKRVLRELRAALAGAEPMRRLLQGDVGSGKTVVAAACALMTLESGYNVALMAPTEILANQHFNNFSRWFEPLGIEVLLRTGAVKTESETLFEPSRPQMVIGTHALVEEGFKIEKLGLVIIDEQHKFGVSQRERLLRKGHYPHLLVMTATPIPRTLGLTLYGDLDVTVLDQSPNAGLGQGRSQVRTFVRGADRLPKVWEFVRQQLAQGRQACVVYPLIDAPEVAGLKAVTAELENVRRALAPSSVELLHGRMTATEKERVMSEFREGRLGVLLATSVIEVGVDVPNATVMVIENADRFGLAQLHQLRGRIGRGGQKSWCILIAAAKTPEAEQRLRIMAETNDGFRIAEEDLALRGPGEFLGRNQSGLPPFRFGNLATDLKLIEQARLMAAQLLEKVTA
jgi:ATP-dependent DNA helicase RecG